MYLQFSVFINYYIGTSGGVAMIKKAFAPRVTNFSISCDPSMLDWLDNYAIKNHTSRSRIVRKALIDFRAEHEEAPGDGTPPLMDPSARCVECDALVMRMPGVRPICTASSAHVNLDLEELKLKGLRLG